MEGLKYCFLFWSTIGSVQCMHMCPYICRWTHKMHSCMSFWERDLWHKRRSVSNLSHWTTSPEIWASKVGTHQPHHSATEDPQWWSQFTIYFLLCKTFSWMVSYAFIRQFHLCHCLGYPFQGPLVSTNSIRFFLSFCHMTEQSMYRSICNIVESKKLVQAGRATSG